MSNSPNLPHNSMDANAFLMGGGVPSASFLHIGDSVTGVICEPPSVQQQRDMQTGEPKTWEDGRPMEQLVVTLQTAEYDGKIEDDDGRRRVYIKSHMKRAVQEAVRKSKGKGIEVGGQLTITYTSDGDPTKRGFNPPKFYSAVYVPPADSFLDSDEPYDEQQRAPLTPQPAGSRGNDTVRITEVVAHNAGPRGMFWEVKTPSGVFWIDDADAAEVAQKVAADSNSAAFIAYEVNAKNARVVLSIKKMSAQPVDQTRPEDVEVPF